ncbi:transcriptional regulator [Kordiimonas sediminis]|uniref:Transcriptional regulator n=1 Tax=Kordiimonas sediminis TaxID=1735581 RepID=A0A919ANP3_9PROT|nr:transcriptional regulator [Kordiimonas sediminis]GHF15838.1 transcriptional regulator [Kordiimonas sediminis]
MTDFDYRAIDDVIHSRVRLAIMSYLMTAGSADFTALKKETKVSDGNLSTHLSKLEANGYVIVEKSFVDKKPQTTVRVSDTGREKFKAYVDSLAALIGTA